ncbi:zinc finger protein 250-like [Pseudophryne corroboree]|uniref:zinc finger protein 250-like n=1 Tax=Pseudophryne corroboree TaxID=495146 RepID=UPI003081B43C
MAGVPGPEVSVSFDDVAVIFSGEEWELLNKQQRALYMEVMKENYEHFIFLGCKVPIILSWLQNADVAAKEAAACPALPVPTDAKGPTARRKRTSDSSAKENRAVITQEAPAEKPAKKRSKRVRWDDSQGEQKLVASSYESQGDPILSPHGRNLRQRKQFYCSECEKCFRYNSALEAHLRVHSGDKPHKCDLCKETFSYKSALIVHRRQHSQASTSTAAAMPTSSLPEAATAVVGKSSTPKPSTNTASVPDSADAETASSTSSNVPSNSSGGSPSASGEKPLKCNFCEKRFNDRSILEAHHRIHTGKLAYPCALCDESFSKPSLLAAHNNTHKEGKPYQCDQCDKNFNDQSLLVAHKRTHTGEKPHKCSHCNKWFPNRSSLVEHEECHLKPKPYKCRHCEKSFNDKSLLITHEGVHTDTKPFKCPQCNESFFLKTQLVSHQATHAPDKPFPCSQCERSFNKKETLLAHIRVHNVQNMQTRKPRRQ